MKRFALILAAAVTLAAGAIAALTLAPAASAWDWQSLPSGYFVSSYQTCYDDQGTNHMPDCGTVPVCDHMTIQSSGGSFTEADCVDGFQGDLDRFVDSTICTVNPAAGGQACAPTTTAPPDAGITTTTPTTTAPDTTQATTTDPGTTTDPATTTTTVDTTAAVIDKLTQQIAALAQQISDLTTRVDRLEQASDAAALAYQQAIANGDDPVTAAEIARDTAWNAVYGLGQFAP